jgi:hypothetical protein
MVAFLSGAVLTAANLNSAFNALTFRAVTGTSDTFVLADNGGAVSYSNASPITATVPPFSSVAYANGTVIQLLNLGAGVVTITAGVGVTLNGSIVTLAQNAGGTLIKTATNTWYFLPSATASAVLQVKSTAKTDTFTMSSATLADVTGLSVSITPASASNLVLVTVHLSFDANEASTGLNGALFRGATQIALGDAAGSRLRRTWPRAAGQASNTVGGTLSMMFLDTPATTSATTYKLQIASDQATAIYVNRSTLDTDGTTFTRAISTITVMEVTP